MGTDGMGFYSNENVLSAPQDGLLCALESSISL